MRVSYVCVGNRNASIDRLETSSFTLADYYIMYKEGGMMIAKPCHASSVLRWYSG